MGKYNRYTIRNYHRSRYRHVHRLLRLRRFIDVPCSNTKDPWIEIIDDEYLESLVKPITVTTILDISMRLEELIKEISQIEIPVFAIDDDDVPETQSTCSSGTMDSYIELDQLLLSDTDQPVIHIDNADANGVDTSKPKHSLPSSNSSEIPLDELLESIQQEYESIDSVKRASIGYSTDIETIPSGLFEYTVDKETGFIII